MRLIEQLLIDISERAIDPVKADRAFTKLYELYGSVVRGASVFVCKSFGVKNREEEKDLEQELWIKIFLVAKTFKPKPWTTAAAEERRFFAWLASIAKNIRRQNFRKHVELEFHDKLHTVAEVVSAATLTEQPETLHQEIEEEIFEILHSLTELEAEVMRTTLEHPKKVPTSEIKRIVMTFKTSSSNIRKIRRQVLARIKMLVLTKYHSIS